MRLVSGPTTWPGPCRPPDARPRPRSATGRCSPSAGSPPPATSRSRSWPTTTARSSTLGERECSIQRRHQKIIEEAPSPAVDDLQRERLGIAAVALARAIDYDNVGTVEFLLDDTTGEFFFLEMNTRIQVEHRVTEEITGCDLVATQIRSATGGGLAEEDADLEIRGHAVEARLYAEEPARDWLPAVGAVHRFDDDQDEASTTWWWTGPSPPARSSAPSSTPCWPRSSPTARPGTWPSAASSGTCAAWRCTASPPTATSCSPCWRTRTSSTATPPPHFVADHPPLLDAGPDPETVAAHAAATAVARAALRPGRAAVGVRPRRLAQRRRPGASPRSLRADDRASRW